MTAHWLRAGNPGITQLNVRDSLYMEAAEEILASPRAVADPLLRQLAIAVLDALRDGAADDRLYVETIARLIALHLMRANSAKSPPVYRARS